jgi:DNA-binding SARP family transcriptional activator
VLYLLNAQGNLYRQQGDMLRAAALLRRAYEEARERSAEYEKAQAAIALGMLHCEQGNLGTARDYLAEAQTVFARMGTRHELARVYLQFARLASLEGRQAAAHENLAAVFRATLELGTHAFLVPDARRALSVLRFGLGRKVGGEALADLLKRAEAPLGPAQRERSGLPVHGASPQPVRVFGLGALRVYRGESLVTPDEWRANKVRELLYFLLYNGDSRRDDIGLALWPDATTAQVSDVFHVTLHRLRRALGAPEWILFRGDAYAFNRSLPFWYDVEEFQSLLRSAQELESAAPAEAVERYRRAMDLYQGDFLGDLVTEWALPHQRKLAQAFEVGLRRLARLYLGRHDLEDALGCYHRLLERDYFREDIHRDVMLAYARQGQPTMAHNHYRRLQRRLKLELEVDPEPATRELYQAIRAGRLPQERSPLAKPVSDETRLVGKAQ